ncbi:hypothetical protein PSTT_12184 [Puccinia striiformis]|uniref:Cytochrome b-c1 complex subunit Rieske transmembrane domain-containing protein n=1 Tax=Puccinia striiformis TaxID=27350 RepID=A0A2S4UX83_9BASI|nr:hypothetical protein PSTT_12184 [Puccinia striiformis]
MLERTHTQSTKTQKREQKLVEYIEKMAFNNLSAISRKSFTLPTTVASSAKGIPIAPRLNLAARGVHDAHGEHHDDAHGPSSIKDRHNFRIPSFATRVAVPTSSIAQLSSRTPTNANPTLSHQRQFGTSTAKASMIPKTSGTATYQDTREVPNYSSYKTVSEDTGRVFSYLMVGSMGLVTASGAKSLVSDFLTNLSASADVLALAKVEIDLANIPEGKNVIIKWRGKPVFIRHRTPAEIDEANSVDISSLRDPKLTLIEPSVRVARHAGCLYSSWLCADRRGWRFRWMATVLIWFVMSFRSDSYNSKDDNPFSLMNYFYSNHSIFHFPIPDISGRARRGPAPLNLEVPAYDFNDEEGK